MSKPRIVIHVERRTHQRQSDYIPKGDLNNIHLSHKIRLEKYMDSIKSLVELKTKIMSTVMPTIIVHPADNEIKYKYTPEQTKLLQFIDEYIEIVRTNLIKGIN